ncbi:putative phytanoyl-CoA dioxygenase [Cavenderia fasciculata]|uniref:Phytanoyl-CoA dioxygenase n=1 Tax=Cavenderia fasciculata TaxID=261658 RepID=F4PNJ3_CACFS|nr:putative phytanoyl-CoA dioxygenase [Cavenderia fasciculata]EGG23046.1 putative phytanoyl-CoA dioxygenase [Cavenderia fasciculata]|eukprot:XP_004360897.1 putative phytanoyl-CoA dioxygenase [Cavenderia fasciculata]
MTHNVLCVCYEFKAKQRWVIGLLFVHYSVLVLIYIYLSMEGIKRYVRGFLNKPPQEERNVIEYEDLGDSYVLPEDYTVEVDQEGYLKSFSLDQVEEYKQFFNRFGFVIIRDCLNVEQCQNTIDDIWNHIEKENWRYHKRQEDTQIIHRDDPKTWEPWTSMAQSGILGGPPVFSRQAILNRSSLNIHQVYANLLGRQDLYINHDRYGLFRPTLLKDENMFPKMTPNHQYIKELENDPNHPNVFERPDWKTLRNVHLDCNPWAYLEEKTDSTRQRILSALQYELKSSDFILENNEIGIKSLDELHIQGLLNLADNLTDDGGFIVVPGFPNHFEEWSKKNGLLKRNNGVKNRFILLHPTSPIQPVRTTARAGSLILWNQKMAHGSLPNHSTRPRIAQFIKVSPAPFFSKDKALLRSNRIKESIDPETLQHLNDTLTDQQKRFIGIQTYQ